MFRRRQRMTAPAPAEVLPSRADLIALLTETRRTQMLARLDRDSRREALCAEVLDDILSSSTP